MTRSAKIGRFFLSGMLLSLAMMALSCQSLRLADERETSGQATTSRSDHPRVVYVIRHAEKERIPGAQDPPLTVEGKARAKALATLFHDSPLDAIFATQFTRTQETVADLAADQGLEITEIEAQETVGLVALVRGMAGKKIMIAGHSNTVPNIVAGLGVDEKITIGHSGFGDLFVVTWKSDSAVVDRRRFGDPPLGNDKSAPSLPDDSAAGHH